MLLSNPYLLLYLSTYKISNTDCLDETTIPVDMIRYLSLYYLINDLVHLPNLIRIRYTPSNKQKLVNMKHFMARNVIERSFGLVKMCWVTLMSRSYYLIKIQTCIIRVCCLLYNFIPREMHIDPMKEQLCINLKAQIHNKDIYIDAKSINLIHNKDIEIGRASCRERV